MRPQVQDELDRIVTWSHFGDFNLDNDLTKSCAIELAVF